MFSRYKIQHSDILQLKYNYLLSILIQFHMIMFIGWGRKGAFKLGAVLNSDYILLSDNAIFSFFRSNVDNTNLRVCHIFSPHCSNSLVVNSD